MPSFTSVHGTEAPIVYRFPGSSRATAGTSRPGDKQVRSGFENSRVAQDVSPFGTPRLQTVGQAQLSISYDLDLFGRLANASEAALVSGLDVRCAANQQDVVHFLAGNAALARPCGERGYWPVARCASCNRSA